MSNKIAFASIIVAAGIALSPSAASAMTSFDTGVFSWPSGLNERKETKSENTQSFGSSGVLEIFRPNQDNSSDEQSDE